MRGLECMVEQLLQSNSAIWCRMILWRWHHRQGYPCYGRINHAYRHQDAPWPVQLPRKMRKYGNPVYFILKSGKVHKESSARSRKVYMRGLEEVSNIAENNARSHGAAITWIVGFMF